MTKMIYLDESVWLEEINGWHIVDCAVRDIGTVYLCLRKDIPHEEASKMWNHDIPTQMFMVDLDGTGSDYGSRGLIGYNRPVLGVTRKPLRHALLVARNDDGQVSVMGGGRKFPDEFIAPGKTPFTERIKCINDYAYSVGSDRKIYKRTDIGVWETFAELTEDDYPGYDIADYGFNDMDAFSETDIYAVGGRGDVWHFDGKEWTQQGFPSNQQLGTVTCAGDGYVYVSGEGGTLWRGKMSTWERVYKGHSTILWNDVLWFKDKLWLSSDYEARIWDGKKMQPITHNGEQVPIYGHMDAYTDPETGEGLLVIASPWYVMAYNGSDWRTLVAPYDDDDEDDDDADEEDEDDDE